MDANVKYAWEVSVQIIYNNPTLQRALVRTVINEILNSDTLGINLVALLVKLSASILKYKFNASRLLYIVYQGAFGVGLQREDVFPRFSREITYIMYMHCILKIRQCLNSLAFPLVPSQSQ